MQTNSEADAGTVSRMLIAQMFLRRKNNLTAMYTLPWVKIEEKERHSLESELARELPEGHVLSRSEVVAVARRVDRDDALFQIAGCPRLALVHLTYTVESNSSWPSTVIYESFAEFEGQRMKLDSQEYGE